MAGRALGSWRAPGAANRSVWKADDAAQNSQHSRPNQAAHTEWRFARLDDPLARLMAIVEIPWFVEWWRGLSDGKIDCLHCGRQCTVNQVGMTGAVRVDRDQMLTVTVCAGCYDRSPTFEDAGRAAVAAAEAGLLSKGRAFVHGVAAPEAVQ